MTFSSLSFISFFFIVVLVHYILPLKLRTPWLLLASYYFYMSWNATYGLLLLGITLITYFSGLIIERLHSHTDPRMHTIYLPRLLLFLCAAIVFGILVYFKYANFFYSCFSFVMQKLHIFIPPKNFDVLLPMGISFICFQTFGYVADVYQKKTSAEKNFLRYALFSSFFPLVLSGPIERSTNFLRQLRTPNSKINYDRFTNGLILMLYGYFQKMVVADKISILVNNVFAAPGQYDPLVLFLAAAAFSFQIYCDFCGYSNLALGVAQVLNFDVIDNFNAPYLSRSISEFWRRWHISLSTWFRDYVYIPLGGNRRGKTRKYFNLMITFLLSGLWHGAHGHFIVWGAINGFYQILESEWRNLSKKLSLPIKKDTFSYPLLQILTTWILTTFAWIFFKASSVGNAMQYISCMLSPIHLSVLFDGTLVTLGLSTPDLIIFIFGLLIILLVDILRDRQKMRIDQYLSSQNLWFKWAALLLFIALIVVFGEYGSYHNTSDFIYLQF